MSAIAFTLHRDAKTSGSWLKRLRAAVSAFNARSRYVAELEKLSDDRLDDIGVSRADISTRFRTEMNAVERIHGSAMNRF